MVTVEIGPEHATYRIHKALLVHHSDYFRNALRACWKEGEEKQVILDDLEPSAFDVFVDWLYTKRIPKTEQQWLMPEPGEEMYPYNCRMNLLRLKAYVVADRLGAQELLQAINNNYVDDASKGPPWYEEIIYAFANIPSERRILKVLVAAHCTYSQADDDGEWEDQTELRNNLPLEFLLQVLKCYQEICEGGKWGQLLGACVFHEHVTDKERQKCEQKEAEAWLEKCKQRAEEGLD
jgi:hypothetical protein